MFQELTIGVCYYPEHWDRAMWENDLDRMKDHGIKVVRIAEFAWNKFEPEEGQFTFKFFDSFLELCSKKGMKVIMCTPTATPPAWLTSNYPEVLNADIDGSKFQHGMRRHANMNAPKYLELSAKITEKIAEHYGENPSVAGWQIDNEINCERDTYYSESDHKAFVEYMKEKYKTLDALNEAMGTVFWNQTYTDWSQIRLTQKTNCGGTNPHMALEEKRFISHTCINYITMQAQIIRKYSKNQFITTNGLFNNLDYHALIGDVLDFITYDNYPGFAYGMWQDIEEKELNDRDAVFNLTRSRSISGQFGIMEQQAGAGGWNSRMEQPMPKPGQIRLWALEAIAEGADFVSFFRWRTATFGTEIYWHGLNDYSNTDNRRLRELKSFHEAVEKLQPVWNKKYIAQAAILTDYDNEWDGNNDLWHGPVTRRSTAGWVKALEFSHITYDFVNVTDELTYDSIKKYEFLVYPHPTIMTRERARVLEQYVVEGGKLIAGCRSGYKDLRGQCVTMVMPGYLAEVFGTEVEDYTFVSPEIRNQSVQILTGENPDAIDSKAHDIELPAPVFNDILRPTTAKTIGVFTDNYYKDAPGLTENCYGKGKAYYFGGGFDQETAEGLLQIMEIAPAYGNLIQAPEGVQLTARGDGKDTYLFLLNFKKEKAAVHFNEKMTDLISGKTYEGAAEMDGYEVLCVKCR